jgi:hypothetical protein
MPPDMTKHELLAEVEDILRAAPYGLQGFGSAHEALLVWLGCATAALERWDFSKGLSVGLPVTGLFR